MQGISVPQASNFFFSRLLYAPFTVYDNYIYGDVAYSLSPVKIYYSVYVIQQHIWHIFHCIPVICSNKIKMTRYGMQMILLGVGPSLWQT